LQVTMQPVQEQARQNAAANAAAAEAGRLADRLGPGAPASSGKAAADAARMQPAPQQQQQQQRQQAPDLAFSRPAKACRHSLGSSPTKPELLGNGLHDSQMPDQAAHVSSSNGTGDAPGQEGAASETSSVAASEELYERAWFGATPGQVRAEARRPILAQVDRQLFGRILLSLETMPHHLPDTYLTALQLL
jgi:hypothetical protein